MYGSNYSSHATSSQNSYCTGAHETLVEPCFMICKRLNMSILLDYTQDHTIVSPCKGTWMSRYSLHYNRKKTLQFSLRQQSLPLVTHKWFTDPSENCFCTKTDLSESQKTHYTGYVRIRSSLVAVCLSPNVNQSISEDSKEIGLCSFQTCLQTSFFNISQTSRGGKKGGGEGGGRENTHRFGHL